MFFFPRSVDHNSIKVKHRVEKMSSVRCCWLRGEQIHKNTAYYVVRDHSVCPDMGAVGRHLSAVDFSARYTFLSLSFNANLELIYRIGGYVIAVELGRMSFALLSLLISPLLPSVVK